MSRNERTNFAQRWVLYEPNDGKNTTHDPSDINNVTKDREQRHQRNRLTWYKRSETAKLGDEDVPRGSPGSTPLATSMTRKKSIARLDNQLTNSNSNGLSGTSTLWVGAEWHINSAPSATADTHGSNLLRLNVGHVWAPEHCVVTGILTVTDYTFTTLD